MHPAPQIRVLFLGPLRLDLQCASCEIDYPPCGSQELFWTSLLERFPSLQSRRASLRLARNDEFIDPNSELNPGDEIALIPPVSGG